MLNLRHRDKLSMRFAMHKYDDRWRRLEHFPVTKHLSAGIIAPEE